MPNKIVTNIENIVRRLRFLVESVNHSALDVIEDAVSVIKAKMEVEPGPPSYPIHWDSEKQRRYVMAKLRAENNLPYKRTHAYAEGWVQERSDEGISLSHAHPAAAIGGFYMGWQSEIHKGNWQSLTRAVDEVEAQLPTKIQDAVYKESEAVLKVD